MGDYTVVDFCYDQGEFEFEHLGDYYYAVLKGTMWEVGDMEFSGMVQLLDYFHQDISVVGWDY